MRPKETCEDDAGCARTGCTPPLSGVGTAADFHEGKRTNGDGDISACGGSGRAFFILLLCRLPFPCQKETKRSSFKIDNVHLTQSFSFSPFVTPFCETRVKCYVERTNARRA